MNTRKRTYREIQNSGEIQIKTCEVPKYLESQKFYFQYSLTKDGKRKPRTAFISFDKEDEIPQNISLSYEKTEEIMTLHRYTLPLVKPLEENAAIDYISNQIKIFDEEKKNTKILLKKKNIQSKKSKNNEKG